jgi:hypothetical protein
VKLLVLCCIGLLLAGCGGVSQEAAPSRASVRGQQLPTVAGTTWRWSNGNGVEFLPGGRVRFTNYAYGGAWQQDGANVTFDQNGATLFDVVIAGDVMSGTWRRLKGDDTRSTSPTYLRRSPGNAE